ncbi:MAG: hypothetical protein IT581_18080 [Verrucomicrobiales bacterium]|nr:hypothetical protein [Verrucomicrobiales bacterium]
MAQLLEVTEWDVEEDLGQLRAGGLVVENREGLRIYPDLLADAVVVDALASRTGPGAFLGRAVIEKLPFQDYPALLRNLAQADWEYRQRHGPGESIFDVVWSRFLHLFDSVSVDERGRMLDRWAVLAVFQPERTLELARHVLNASTGTTEDKGESALRFSDKGRLGRIVAILEPIATWHQHLAGEALDLLWTIARRSPAVVNRDDRHPITAIARAASFQVGKPVSASEGVLSWLEKVLADAGSIGWFRNQPWIIGALLSPFFGRVVEQQWTTGMTFHLRDIPIDGTRTRSMRLRALQLVERLLNLSDLRIFGGTIPVLEEALRAPGPARGLERWEWAFDDWRNDRIEALEVAARFLKSHPQNVVELLRVNRAVVWYGVHDGDHEFREAIIGLKGCFPDQLEYRLALALSEGEQLEFVDVDPTKRAVDCAAIEARKSEFVSAVASEVLRRYDASDEFLRDLRRLVQDLGAAGISVGGRPLMAAIADASGEWRDALLEALLKASDGVLDRLLFPLLDKARQVRSSIYTSVLNAIPMTWSRGPTEAWVDLISWVIRKGMVLVEAERRFIDALAERPDDWMPSVLSRFAFRVADKDAPWAVAILKRLRPKDDESLEWYLMALSELTKQREGIADLDLSESLRAIDLSKANGNPTIENSLEEIARRHPMVVFFSFREKADRYDNATNVEEAPHYPIAIPPLGRVEDRVLLEAEVHSLWRSAVELKEGRFVRVSLAQALVNANPEAIRAILPRFIQECRSADDLEVLVEIVAPRGSRFVFSHPDLVRTLIGRATELSGREQVARALKVSAVGGGRGWTGDKLDPEYRYILDQAKLLANRHKEDPALREFYSGIVCYEESTEAEHRAWYAQAHRDG